jgi:biopolymer transport protein ExbB/TolQ
MQGFELLLEYIHRSSVITIAVLVVLSIYFVAINWIFLYRYFLLNNWLKKEEGALEYLYIGSKNISQTSVLYNCLKKSKDFSKETLEFCKYASVKEATYGLTPLSIAASTSPFIGLFGTVVSILETFSILGTSKASIGAIAPAIGEALVATAAGIFVAVFAYSYHLMLKRKGFEIISIIQMQGELLLSSR